MNMHACSVWAIKCLKDYEISGFIEINCDKLHIDLFEIDLIQPTMK